MSGRMRRIALLAVLLVLATGTPAAAHITSTTGYSVIRSGGSEVWYQLSLEPQLLARAAGIGPDAVLADHREALASYLEPRVAVFLDEVACQMRLVEVGAEQRQGIGYARLGLAFGCPGSPSGSYRVQYGVFAESDGVVEDHTNVVDYALGGHAGRVVLDEGHRGFVTGDRTFWPSATRFVGLGVGHILFGLDHVLFLMALLLGAASVSSVAKAVSMFTLAHSVTLGLGALGWVNLPAEIVEPLIALSIAYVAAENVLGQPSRHRLAVVFGFGLLHGLGFASSLRSTDELSWSLVSSLVGFNLGIEAGQLGLVLLLFPLLLFARRFWWSVPVQLGATGVIGAMGLFWFVERTVLS